MRPHAVGVRNLMACDSPQTRALSATFALRNWEFAMDRDPECSFSAESGGNWHINHSATERANFQSPQTAIRSQPAVAPPTGEDACIPEDFQDHGRKRERPLKSPARQSWNRLLAAAGLRCSESRSAHSLLEAARGQAEVAPMVGAPHSERRTEVRRLDFGVDGLSSREARRPVPIVARR
jgi:hypothetical protein